MFELTRDKVWLNQRISAIAAAVSLACCLSVLTVAAWVRGVPRARNFLDRVSFRLLLWCLAWEIVYDINYISVVFGARPNRGCAVGIYFMIATLSIVNYLCTCIAVNLFVTIVLGLNPLRMKLERWYIGVSLFVGLFVPIVPAALDHFGWDPIFGVCWIKSDVESSRITNFVLDLYLWQLLSCFIAIVAVAVSLFKLFQQGRATSRALFGGDSLNFEMSNGTDDETKRGRRPRRLFNRRRSAERERTFGHLEDRFISIAIRVSMYPIALVIINGIIAIGDLYISSVGGVKSRSVYGLYAVYYFLYGFRGVVFASLATFVDPSLIKAFKAAWAERFPHPQGALPPMTGKDASWSLPEPMGCVAPLASEADGTIDPLSTQTPGVPSGAVLNRLSVDSDSSMDVLQALFASEPPPTGSAGRPGLDEEKRHGFRSHLPHLPHSYGHHLPHLHLPNIKHLPWFMRRHIEREVEEASAAAVASPSVPSPDAPPSPAPTPGSFTNAFAGVPADAMPFGMEDHADDVVAPEALASATAVTAPDTAALELALARISSGESGDTNRSKGQAEGTPFGTPPLRRPSIAHVLPAAVTSAFGRRPSHASAGSGISAGGMGHNSARQSFTISGAAGMGSRRGSGQGSSALRGSVRSGNEGNTAQLRYGIRRGVNSYGTRSSIAGSAVDMHSPLAFGGITDQRARRQATVALAEKLYEEIEAQL